MLFKAPAAFGRRIQNMTKLGRSAESGDGGADMKGRRGAISQKKKNKTRGNNSCDTDDGREAGKSSDQTKQGSRFTVFYRLNLESFCQTPRNRSEPLKPLLSFWIRFRQLKRSSGPVLSRF